MFLNILKVAGFLVALVFFGYAIILAIGTRTMLRRAQITFGRVFQVTTPFYNGPRYYRGKIGKFVFLHITFVNPYGQQVVFKSARISFRSGYRIGDIVKVVFDPTGKSQPRVNSVRGIWGNSFEMAGYGAVGLVISLWAILQEFIPRFY